MMNQVNQEKPSERPEPQVPEFKPEYYWAFVALMLYKLGGSETITQERLEKFDIEGVPDVFFVHDDKAWVMRLKENDAPKRVLVPVSGKILKQQRKILKGFLS